MNYYKIEIDFNIDKVKTRTPPSAFLSQEMAGAEYLFRSVKDKPELSKKLLAYQLVNDVPLLDYFVLKEIYGSSKRKFDWIELDVYKMALDGGLLQTSDWLISDRFMQVVDKFNSQPLRYHPSKLLYKGKFLDYYLLHWGELFNPVFEECTYIIQDKIDYSFDILDPKEKPAQIIMQTAPICASELGIKSQNDYLTVSLKLHELNKNLLFKTYAYPQRYDFLKVSHPGGVLVSELLKESLEASGITGIKAESLEGNTISFLKT
jgi:hypothetical protein